MGVTVLYGYTGTLHLAQMGRSLTSHRPDGVVAVALAMLCAGFLVKAAVVPWHFWLPDAYGAAAAPTCVIFAGLDILTALTGTAMSMVESYERRILGFVVVAHMGRLYLLGFALAGRGGVGDHRRRHQRGHPRLSSPGGARRYSGGGLTI